jgi:FkbM family methyltransferase
MKDISRVAAKAFRLLPHAGYRRALFRGVGAAIEHEAVLRRLGADGIQRVVDIGANVGQFSLAVRRCIPSAQIDSFEPLAGPAAVFSRVFEGDSAVTLHRCAVGPAPAIVGMHVSAANDSSSLLPISALQEEIFPGTREVGRETVRVATLDTEIEAPDLAERALLKVDVQGYEVEALRGCESLLDRFHAVYVEASFIELYEGQGLAHEVIDFLHGWDFVLVGIFNTTYASNGLAVQGDFLFLRRSPNREGLQSPQA